MLSALGKFAIYLTCLLLGLQANAQRYKYPHPAKRLDSVVNIEVEYNHNCHAAPWSLKQDLARKFEDQDKRREFIEQNAIFLEPSDSFTKHESRWNVFNLWNGKSAHFVLLLTGSFYSGIGYPLHYKEKEHCEPARVFRYTSLKVLKGGNLKK